MFLRGLLENLLRDKTRKRHLPSSLGGLPFYASTAGGLRQLFKPIKDVDPDLFETAKALVRPGDVVWDIGANVGLFTFSSAFLAGARGQLWSFEPDAKLVQLLRKSAALQDGATAEINIIPAGIAGATGIRSFLIAKRARASNALEEYGNAGTGGVREKQSIVCLSVNDVIAKIPHPNIVKIDVEGAEVELLTAATLLFDDVRPLMAIEVSPSNQEAVTDILKNNTYVMFDANAVLNRENEVEVAAWNTIAIPRERVDSFFKP